MGWASRLNRHPNAVVLTAQRCGELAASVRESLAQLDIEPAGDIATFLREAEWLGSSPIDPFEEGGVAFLDRERGIPAFLMMEQFIRIDEMLKLATGIENAASIARWVRGRFDRIAQQDGQAQDYLFELEIASRAHRSEILKVTLGEPDILLGPPGLDPMMGLACKRPLRLATVGRAILKARDQITRRGLPGIIVIGMEAIFHYSEERPSVIYRAERLEDLTAEGQQQIDAAIASAQAEVDRAFQSDKVSGVLFWGGISGLLAFPQSYSFEWVTRPVPRPGGDPRTVRLIEKLLFGAGAP
jgi:hypothetical protein